MADARIEELLADQKVFVYALKRRSRIIDALVTLLVDEGFVSLPEDEVNLPTIKLEPVMMTDAEIERVCSPARGYGPDLAVCGFCFGEIETDCVIECEHAHLCQACAPCDQCE